jgi:hypothetical protein
MYAIYDTLWWKRNTILQTYNLAYTMNKEIAVTKESLTIAAEKEL